MGRPPRDFDCEQAYHLTSHGIDDRPIFLDDVDRQAFALRLLRVARRHEWGIWSVCLMDTHYHLVVQPLRTEMAAGMRVLNGAHSRFFNRRHERRGALFEARYSAEAIVDDDHLAAATAAARCLTP